MTPLEIFNVAKETALAIAAMVTAGAAVYGLRTWKRELKGKAEFEAARGLARATYRLRDELGYFRSPLLKASEFPDGDSESAQAYRHLYSNRWRPVVEAMNSFEAAALEAESLWGASIRSNTDKMMTCVRSLHVATEAMLEDKSVKGENFNADRDFGRRMRADVAGTYASADNPLSEAITAAVAAIEEVLKPPLARK